MTTNQLKYWELRWKQWYEYQLLLHKKAELAEQKRATRVKEKQEYERITIEQGDLNRKWEELSEKKRAAIVGEALRKYEADIQLMNVQSMADQRLQQMKTVAADLYLQYTKAEDESQRKWYEAYAEAANKGWGQGAFYAAYEMADRSNLVTKGKEDMAEIFNSIPGFKVPNSNSVFNTRSDGKITAEVSNNKGILAVSKSGPSSSKLGETLKSVGNEFSNLRNKLALEQHPYAKDVEKAKQAAGTNYKANNNLAITRDNYQLTPQVGDSNKGGSFVTAAIGPSNFKNGPARSGFSSSGKSNSIITTNIHKGPGYN